MKIYSYRMDHDYGLAPNPFGRYCTVAVCKSTIRRSKNLDLGDWLIGTGSKALEKLTGKAYCTNLIYAMKVTERITMQEYWDSPRFQYKKPCMKGTLMTMFGDNFYHKNESDKWIQEDSAHSNRDGSVNSEHLDKDTVGVYVLISKEFYYFGDKAPRIPSRLLNIRHSTQGQKILDEKLSIAFLNWLTTKFQKGIHGTPIGWPSLKI